MLRHVNMQRVVRGNAIVVEAAILLSLSAHGVSPNLSELEVSGFWGFLSDQKKLHGWNFFGLRIAGIFGQTNTNRVGPSEKLQDVMNTSLRRLALGLIPQMKRWACR